MAEFKCLKILKNKKGQSVVEYILLLGLIASITFIVLNNKKFKTFMGGKSGFFQILSTGMSYSYRYGKEYKPDSDAETELSFNYESANHPTYLNKKENASHFFMGLTPYGE